MRWSSKSDFKPILGPSWGHLGPIFGPSWALLGLSWALLGPSWAHLGPSWPLLGPILAPSGAMLGYLKTVGVFLVIYLAVLSLHLLTYGTMCPSALNAAWRNARSDESAAPSARRERSVLDHRSTLSDSADSA